MIDYLECVWIVKFSFAVVFWWSSLFSRPSKPNFFCILQVTIREPSVRQNHVFFAWYFCFFWSCTVEKDSVIFTKLNCFTDFLLDKTIVHTNLSVFHFHLSSLYTNDFCGFVLNLLRFFAIKEYGIYLNLYYYVYHLCLCFFKSPCNQFRKVFAMF